VLNCSPLLPTSRPTPGVNLIIILRAAFGARRSQKCKKDCQILSLFALLGSVHAKAARRTLMKLTPARLRRMGRRR
jgi:hypothetical protein